MPEATGGATAPQSAEQGGFVVVDKQAGWTSHDVVARCRRLLGTRKVGHAGTLDPDATGVLIVGVGSGDAAACASPPHCTRATWARSCSASAPRTLDASGEVTGRFDMSAVSLEEVREAARSLTGRIQQVPPMVSAVKVGGRRLHELAREGDRGGTRPPGRSRSSASKSSRPARLAVSEVLVDCSSGTYVRVLAADLGTRLSGGAHLRALRRLAVGSFSDLEALALEDVAPAKCPPTRRSSLGT